MLETKKMEYEKECDFQLHPYRQWWKERQEKWKAYFDDSFREVSSATSDGVCATEGNETWLQGVTGQDWIIFASREGELQELFFPILCKYLKENKEACFFYADEDSPNCEKKDEQFAELDDKVPWFKPDWSPDTLQSFFYFGNIFGMKHKYAEKILENTSDIDTAYGFTVFRFTEQQRMTIQELVREQINEFPKSTQQILHIPEIMFHSNASADWENCVRHRIYPVEKDTLISLIIPSRDHPQMLRKCLASIESNIPYEIIVVDNGSNEDNRKELEKLQIEYGFCYIYEKMEFNFSKMCNRGASAAKGNVLLFLNDDITAMDSKWMEILAGQALQVHTGAVGAKLYYPDSRIIQHAGITNMRVGPVHKMGGMCELDGADKIKNIYHMRNQADYNVIGVTAACLAVSKIKFEQVGGFPEELAVAYNDVALCFALYEAGWINVVRNDATLYHHESISRGSDETPEKEERRKQEWRKLYELYPKLYGKDPFYHKDLVQERLDGDFHVEYQYPYENQNCFSKFCIIEDKRRKKKIKHICQPGIFALPGKVFRKLSHSSPEAQMCLDSVKWQEPVVFSPIACGQNMTPALGQSGAPVRSGGLFLEIKGWAALTKEPMLGWKRKLIMWENQSDRYFEATVFDWYREDVADALPEQPYGKLAGFTARICANEWIFPDNQSQYEIGILFEHDGKAMKWIRWNK